MSRWLPQHYVMKLFAHLAFTAAALALPGERTTAPLLSASNAQVVPEQYIIVLKPGVTPQQIDSHLSWLLQLAPPSDDQQIVINAHKKRGRGFHSAFSVHEDLKGYVGTFTNDQIDAIRMAPEVEYVEQDQIMHTWDVEVCLISPSTIRLTTVGKRSLGSWTR